MRVCSNSLCAIVGKVTALFAQKVASVIHAGVDKGALLRSVGIDAARPVLPSQVIDDADYYRFLEEAASADPEGVSLPLRAGATMRTNDYGAFGLAWKSALTLGASYERAVRYWRVLTSVSAYEVEPASDGAYLHLHRRGERHLGMRLSNEATLASIFSISREVASRPFRASAVFLKHDAPLCIDHHESYFGCPVHFGSDRDAIHVPQDVLATPNRLGDAGLSIFFERHLDRETETRTGSDASSLCGRVRLFVSREVCNGVPTLAGVARHFGVSVRSLQRGLRDEGRTFSSLVTEARMHLAERLLTDTEYSLMEVAFMTGYSEQSALTRAFKQWAGRTPGSYRNRVAS